MGKKRNTVPKELAVKTFSYEGIDPEVKGKLVWYVGEGMKLKRQYIASVLEFGEMISSANALLTDSGNHGRFKEWVECELKIGRTTAYEMMWAFERFGRCSPVEQHFGQKAMYLLAAPTVPKAASDEALKLASKGVWVDEEKAKQIIAKHKPKADIPTAKVEHVSDPVPSDEELAAAEKMFPSATSEPAADTVAAATDEAADFDPTALDATEKPSVDLKGLATPYKTAVRALNDLVAQFDGLASEQRTGVFLTDKITRIRFALEQARDTISEAEPVCVCESCGGDGCAICYQSGFWTRAVRKTRK